MEPSAKRKRVVLSLKQKLSVVQRLDKGESARSLAQAFNIGVSSVAAIRNRRDEIMSYASAWNVGDDERKIIKISSSKELDEAVYKWYTQMKKDGHVITCQQICEKAEELNKAFVGSKDFKACPNWLKNFIAKHSVDFARTPSEANPNLFKNKNGGRSKTKNSDPPRVKRKRIVLSLKQKMDIIFRIKMGESESVLAKEYNISKSTLSGLKTNEGNIQNYVSTFESFDAIDRRKTMKTAENKDLDTAVYAWYREAVDNGQNVSGPDLCEKALDMNKQRNGSSKFKASSGWLHNFKLRHGLLRKQYKPRNQNNSDSSQDVPSDMQDYYHQSQVYPYCDVILTVPDDGPNSSSSGTLTNEKMTSKNKTNDNQSDCETPILLKTLSRNDKCLEESVFKKSPQNDEKVLGQSSLNLPIANNILNSTDVLIEWVESEKECTSIDLLHLLRLRDHAIRKVMSVSFSSNDLEVISRKLSPVKNETRHPSISIQSMYEIERCVSWILKNEFSKIALQFPDDMLNDATSVALMLGDLTQKSIYILGDTSYGSCCVDEIAAEHSSADAIIHYGHSCLSPTKRLPVLYIFGKIIIDVEDAVDAFRKLFPDSNQPILIMYEVMCSHAVDEISHHLQDYKNLIVSRLEVPDSKFQTSENVAECNDFLDFIKCHRHIRMPHSQSINDYYVYFIGCRDTTLTNLMISLKDCKFYSYSPLTKLARAETLDINKHLKRRYYYIEKAKDAKIIGILVGTLGVSDYMGIIRHLKDIIQKAGKRSYVMVIGKLNVAKLANFSEIDVFVNVACIESSLVESRDFYQSIITPFELEIALNDARHWTGDYIADFREILPGASSYITSCVKTETEGDVSLVTGKIRHTVLSSEEALVAEEGALVSRNQMSLSTLHKQGAGEFLAERNWKGLEQCLGETPVSCIEEGQKGIASEYEGESSNKEHH